MTPDDPRHGTSAGRHAHRSDDEDPCTACKRAAARYEQEIQLDLLAGRRRTMPAQGTRRRIQALVALGHDFGAIGDALGMQAVSAGAIARRRRRSDTVFATTATKIAALYDAWSMRLPADDTPRQRRAAAYARTTARRNGWLPPLAWDDIDNDPHPPTGIPIRDYVDHAVVDRFFNSVDPRELRALARQSTTATRHAITNTWLDTGRSWNDLEQITGWQHGRYGRTRASERTAA